MGEAVGVVRLIREQLREVVGRRIASAVAETRIRQLLQLYGEEEEGLRCVLHTLLEEVFNEEDQDGFVVFDKEEIESVSTLTDLGFVAMLIDILMKIPDFLSMQHVSALYTQVYHILTTGST